MVENKPDSGNLCNIETFTGIEFNSAYTLSLATSSPFALKCMCFPVKTSIYIRQLIFFQDRRIVIVFYICDTVERLDSFYKYLYSCYIVIYSSFLYTRLRGSAGNRYLWVLLCALNTYWFLKTLLTLNCRGKIG